MDKTKYNNHILMGLSLILLFAQRFIFGFNYYPTVDDWFLYLGKSILIPEGLAVPDLATRPFAGLFDHYIIAPLSDKLVLIEILFMIMLVAAAYWLFRAIFPKSRDTDIIFILMITMLPVSIEGFYWIAAVTRIVPSLFFIGLSAFTLRRYFECDKASYLAGYIVSGLFAVGFYEAFIPVYIVLCSAIVISEKHKWWLIAIPLAWSGAMAGYYKLNSTDITISARLEFVKLRDLPEHIDYVYEQYKAMLRHGYELIYGSLIDGLRGIKASPFMGTIAILLSAVLGAFSKPAKKNLWWLIAGVLLIVAGVSLNLVICFVRVPFRLFVLMIIGIAIIVSVALSYLPKLPYKIIAGAMAMLFTICNIGSVMLYKYTYEMDNKIATSLINEHNVTESDKLTYIVNAPSYWYNDRVIHYEYVKATTENYATLTGQVQYLTGIAALPNIMCLHEYNTIGMFHPEELNAQFLYYDRGELKPCQWIQNDNGYNVSAGGKTVGYVIITDSNTFVYQNNPQ